MVVISDQSAGKKYLLNFYFDSKLPSNLFEILLLALFGFISTCRAIIEWHFEMALVKGVMLPYILKVMSMTSEKHDVVGVKKFTTSP